MSAFPATCLLVLLTAGAAAQDVTVPSAERVLLDNGSVLILNEKHDVPLIGVRALLKGGAVSDPAGKQGLASVVASLLVRGAADRDAAAFAEAVDAVGGSFTADATLENIELSAEFMSRDADLMLELLADALMNPSLEAAEFTKLRERMVNFIRAAKDSNPGQLMPVYGHAFLFDEHPYGNPVSGSETTLAAITHRDVVDYYAEQIGSDRLVIAVSGDFDAAEMRGKLEAALAEWRPAAAEAVEVTAPAPVTERRVLLIDKPGSTQTFFWIANVGVAMDFPQRADLDIANTVFGGRFTSMLNTALRVESGLTYGARCRLTRPSKPGSVAISSFTRTDATVEAIDTALGTLAQLRQQGIDSEMVDSARNYLLGQFPTALETASQLAALFATLAANDLDAGYIDDYSEALLAVTPETAAVTIGGVYPAQADLLFVLLGDAAEIRDAVAKYGPVTETSISAPSFRQPQAE